MTRMVTITAPGADVLPWDEKHCAWMGKHEHAGLLGCRIDLGAAAAWRASLEKRWHGLCMAARKQAKVNEPVVAALAWECQARGAPHCHVVTVATPAGERYVLALAELAWRYGFGRVHDLGYATRGAYAHAAYLAKYIVKDGNDERARRLAVFEAALLPRQTVWVSSLLTRRTGASMATARLVRSLWAFGEGFRERPPGFKDGVQRAWVYYWRRVDRRGRIAVPRSLVPRDYGSYEPWESLSWPGELHPIVRAAS